MNRETYTLSILYLNENNGTSIPTLSAAVTTSTTGEATALVNFTQTSSNAVATATIIATTGTTFIATGTKMPVLMNGTLATMPASESNIMIEIFNKFSTSNVIIMEEGKIYKINK